VFNFSILLQDLLCCCHSVSLQLELDKTAEEFRKAHTERHELLSRWQETIEQMQKRDNDMELLAAVSLTV
jgi:hypothetical protein